MDSSSQKLIFITLVLAITIPTSSCHGRRWRRSEDPEQYLRKLCSETDRSDVCWNILKSELHRFESSDEGDIADGVIDIAIEKSKEIGKQLNQWYRDSNDDRMREKYHLCSENYADVGRDLEEVQRRLDSDSDSDDRRLILEKIHNAGEGLNKCRREFRSGSFDPGHVGDRNNELGLYLDIVRAGLGPLAILIG